MKSAPGGSKTRQAVAGEGAGKTASTVRVEGRQGSTGGGGSRGAERAREVGTRGGGSDRNGPVKGRDSSGHRAQLGARHDWTHPQWGCMQGRQAWTHCFPPDSSSCPVQWRSAGQRALLVTAMRGRVTRGAAAQSALSARRAAPLQPWPPPRGWRSTRDRAVWVGGGRGGGGGGGWGGGDLKRLGRDGVGCTHAWQMGVTKQGEVDLSQAAQFDQQDCFAAKSDEKQAGAAHQLFQLPIRPLDCLLQVAHHLRLGLQEVAAAARGGRDDGEDGEEQSGGSRRRCTAACAGERLAPLQTNDSQG